MSSPKEIYTTVLAEVDKLIQSFNSHSGSEEIKKAQSEAQGQLKVLQQKLNASLNQLEKNSEWDVFTLAFYGETNAGKSTIIETLRILLNEQGKVQEREKFKKAFAEYSKLQKEIEMCQSKINSIGSEYKDRFTGIEDQLFEISTKLKQIDDQIQLVSVKIGELINMIKREKKSSFVKFLKSIFGKLPEQKQLKETEMALDGIKSEKDGYLKQQKVLHQKKESLNQEIRKKTAKLNADIAESQERVKPCTEKLIANADGKIIGDGHSDFTQTVTSYEFEVNNQKFTLLDMPGIEGNEGLVLDTINSAVQKAHAVFYITKKTTPPQTGENSEGTIDKIKKHLKQQTEVYTIFNKAAKNTRDLKDTLIDPGEAESLKVLDETMRSHLGEQYRESISVSAYPAFLAVGNCWEDVSHRQQEKFLEHFKTFETILDKSCVQTFVNRLTGDMVHNSKEKIKKSNYKKVVEVLEHAIEESGNIRRELLKFNEQSKELNRSADDQLDNVADGLKGALEREAHTAIEKFKSDVRRKIYDDIDSDIDDKKFKSALEERSKEGVEKLQSVLKESVKKQTDEFQKNVSDIVKKYQNNISELLSAYSDAGKFDAKLDLNIDIKSGINWGGTVLSVASAVVGIILASISTGGIAAIVTIVLAAIGAIISVAKAVVGFFNHNYRKSQQRKNADEALEKSGENISKSIEKNLRDSYESLKTSIENIKNELKKLINQVEEKAEILKRTITEFQTMAKDITHEGGR
jgi:DNA repair exonuclease SbcCD ATPase subunit